MSAQPALRVRALATGRPLTLRADRAGVRALGALVRVRREFLGLSQAACAERAGVCFATLARLEAGVTRSPHLRSAVRILEALGYVVIATERVGRGERAA